MILLVRESPRSQFLFLRARQPWKEAQLRRSDGTCVLSLRLWSLFPSIAMDCLANLYLSAAFIVPVARGRFSDAKRLARTSTVATLASLCVTL